MYMYLTQVYAFQFGYHVINSKEQIIGQKCTDIIAVMTRCGLYFKKQLLYMLLILIVTYAL